MYCSVQAGRDCEQVSLGTFLDRGEKGENVEIRQCVHCGHAVTYPPIPDVTYLYGERESQDYQPDTKNGLVWWIKEIAFRQQARKLLCQIGNPGKEALDFGCGSGQFTRVLGELMQDTLLTGSDFFETPPAELASCAYATNGEVEQQREKYDLVIAMHVLEHDDDVKGLLNKITAPAKSGATVVIEVPNVQCFWGKVLGRYWDGWYVPFHRNHFSRRSLTTMLLSHGLDVISVHGLTVPTMGRTMANVFGCRNNLFWLLAGIALHPIQIVGELLSNQPTVIRAIARKP